MIEATDARGAYNAVRPVSVKIKPRSTRRADLQGKKVGARVCSDLHIQGSCLQHA